jgi:hypothetical protein
VKEKRTYKRFELIPFLAILGCIGMFLFECIFIFELYNRLSVEGAMTAIEVPVPKAPAVEMSVPEETNSPAVPSEAVPPVEPEVSANVVPVG